MIVKRLVCIEDLGNIRVLFTDKTGTLTDGKIPLHRRARARRPSARSRVFDLGLACSDRAGQRTRPRSLGLAPTRFPTRPRRMEHARSGLPFDHERQIASVLTRSGDERLVITKGAPERVLSPLHPCDTPKTPPEGAHRPVPSPVLGLWLLRPARRPRRSSSQPRIAQGLSLDGFLCFSDPPKPQVAESLRRLDRLGIAVKVITGDNGLVAQHV